jgi:cytidine deaminase
MIRDEAQPLRFLRGALLADAPAAERCHRDPSAGLTAGSTRFARVTHVVNGVRGATSVRRCSTTAARGRGDRRTGFDAASKNVGRRGDARDRPPSGRRRARRSGEVDLIAAARRALKTPTPRIPLQSRRALETADGTIVTGCNIENATVRPDRSAPSASRCSRRCLKAPGFVRRSPIVAATDAPTPPCGACRQICGSSPAHETRWPTSRREWWCITSKNLLPLPFDDAPARAADPVESSDAHRHCPRRGRRS